MHGTGKVNCFQGCHSLEKYLQFGSCGKYRLE